MISVEVEQVIKGTLVREGAGVKIQRYIGADRNNPFDPFLLFDYFDSDDPMDFMGGFPAHPHRGFETITYLLEGAITHQDNQGRQGTIAAGDVQWMTAGRGIVHSEMPSAPQGKLIGLQLWLNLPAAEKMCNPRYQEYTTDQLPVEQYGQDVTVKVIAGATDSGTQSPLSEIATKPLFFDLTLLAGTAFQQKLSTNYQVLLFVVSGKIKVGEKSIDQQMLASLTSGDLLEIKAEKTSQVLLIAANKLKESVVRYGPFVMNTQEEIVQAFNDFKQGLF